MTFIWHFQIWKSNAERHLKEAIDKLAERWIYIQNNKEKRRIRWIQEEAEYLDGEGKIEIIFADSIMSYLTQLKGQFTKIVIKNVSTLKSVYSIRIYELLIQFQSVGDRLINLEDFRSMLGLDDKKYSTFNSLNQWVIKPAIKELNKKSNLIVSIDTVNKNRNVVTLYFHFKEDQQIKMVI
ncbi:replication initiation protein [Xenorhabdus sp. XENO-7]|uniref:Replication initiation protein n=1 Tax=Xenorhabdus aichiensis TaxID=3025874 RepID=A0ABT5M870_9GAMM|nr:replication initiation protein [Xenorhabdus aichiensis]MDC9623170.1 replication initiation protein [Xenorhabdus aichiensis]